ncbi:Rho GDP-dissociation inhibitor 1 [Acorus calamus]|uniref:Rho GDP-dissociation inhibitor 1 n=1 Tax=Acorus calamus TaxID=4465 RepID=A0AAV9E5K9_ACOCL|nr:Rho GDP-dissociation inhibitor 1 [Acorus calamus]
METVRVEAAGPSAPMEMAVEGDDASEVEGAVEDDEESDIDGGGGGGGGDVGFVPGPLIPLKEQIEKDKDDESLRRWKEKLLGSLEGDLNDQMEPEVTFHSIGIISEGHAEVDTPLPVDENQNLLLFTLREGAQYRLKLAFTVRHNIVSGLVYSNIVWKGSLQVDQSVGYICSSKGALWAYPR